MASVTETVKDFYLKLIPLVQKHVERVLINGSIENFNQLIESIELWDEKTEIDPKMMYLEFRIKPKHRSLLVVSLDVQPPEDDDDFVVLGEAALTRTTSSTGPRPAFGSEILAEHFPTVPLIYRSLLSPQDVELRLVSQPLKDIEHLRKQSYEYTKATAARVKVYSDPGIKAAIKSYCDSKRLSQVQDCLRLKSESEEESKEDLLLLASMLGPQGEQKKLDLEAYRSHPEVYRISEDPGKSARQESRRTLSKQFLATPESPQFLRDLDAHFTQQDGSACEELRAVIHRVRELLEGVPTNQADLTQSEMGTSSFVVLAGPKTPAKPWLQVSQTKPWIAVSGLDEDGLVEI